MLEKLEPIIERYDEINQELMTVGEDYQRAADLARERSEIEPLVQISRDYRSILNRIEEAQLLLESEDPDLVELAEMEIADLQPQIEPLENRIKAMLLPKDPRDDKNVIVEIRAGAGGDEAGIFAADLYRMYTRYAERRNWKTEIISMNDTGVGGFKEVTFTIKGKGAFSRLKYESGVHRVQRVPATESQGRIHTSTATVAMLAEVDDVEIDIPDRDIEIEVFKSAGAGGQSVQKNATAVRIRHLPTGMVVSCQDERSQLQNKMRAMSILRARLYEIEAQRQHEEIAEERRSQVGSGDRSEKIRTYNYPQSRITDHRVGFTSHNLTGMLDGDLDDILDELATHYEAEKLSEAGLNEPG